MEKIRPAHAEVPASDSVSLPRRTHRTAAGHPGFWFAGKAEEAAAFDVWVKDRYGLSWQVVPAMVSEFLAGGDRARASGVVETMMERLQLAFQAPQDAVEGKV